MISKSELKIIKSLQIKKYRREHKKFLVQGEKSVLELAHSDFEVELLLHTSDLADKLKLSFPGIRLEEVKEEVLSSVSSFKSVDTVLAVVKTKENKPLSINDDEYALVLDDVRDPGNLGTILRICDWYGVNKVICSESSADIYNPKVIASSMGSFTRVGVYYTGLSDYLAAHSKPTFGAYMEGESIYHENFPSSGFLVMGNESNGISAELSTLITGKITIPRVGGAESLNVGVATAVILDNITRLRGQ